MNADDLLQLQQPLKEGGIRSVNFFNGRLLTAKDLSREQQAQRDWDARLGLALGEGVAYGLEARRDELLDSTARPVLRVEAGLAINRAGQTLRLAAPASVALVLSLDSASDAACDNTFAACSPVTGGAYVAGAGVYVLTLAPDTASDGRAQTNGLDPANLRCNTDTTIDALQFRLLPLDPQRYTDLDLGSPQFRNRLAYRCFGIEARAQSLADPWRTDPQRHGLVDELRDTPLTDCDVPLALVYLTAAGLQFVDTWAVRRRLIRPDGLSGQAFIARARRLAEAEAMCAQFQQQLGELLAASANPATLTARTHFRYLPPFGLVPLQNLPLRGFGDAAFFWGVVRRPLPGTPQSTPFMDARLLAALRTQALGCPPIDLDTNEFLWSYRPWQALQALGQGKTVQPLLAFASGLAPEMVVARYDMARFDFSNFTTPTVI